MGLVFGQYGLVQPTAGRSTSAFVALGDVDLD